MEILLEHHTFVMGLLWFSPAVIIHRTLLSRSLVDLVNLQELFVLVRVHLFQVVLERRGGPSRGRQLP